jgi:hypothetical protein
MAVYNNGYAAALPRTNALTDIRPLMRLVYVWMSLGLFITGGITLAVASNTELVLSLYDKYIFLAILQLVIVLGLSWGINRMSPMVATGVFFFYAASMGVTLGIIVFSVMLGQLTDREIVRILTNPSEFSAFTATSILPVAKAFFSTAGLFGAMTVIGLTTNIDLTRFGSFLMMALIGLVIASIVNIFLQSDTFSWIISVVGVLLFTGLTAYDTQKIKNWAHEPQYQEMSDDLRRLSIMGALTLYLDFINLFIFLLRIFGMRRD